MEESSSFLPPSTPPANISNSCTCTSVAAITHTARFKHPIGGSELWVDAIRLTWPPAAISVAWTSWPRHEHFFHFPSDRLAAPPLCALSWWFRVRVRDEVHLRQDRRRPCDRPWRTPARSGLSTRQLTGMEPLGSIQFWGERRATPIPVSAFLSRRKG